MRDLPISCTVTHAELDALLTIGRLDSIPASPLAELLDPPAQPRATQHVDLRVLETLADAGWIQSMSPARLRDDCARALGVLAAPQRLLHLKLGSVEGLIGLDLFNDAGSSDGWVRLQSEANGRWARVEFFLGSVTLLERAAHALDLNATFVLPRFHVRWPWERYLVLLGLLDVFRHASLTSILERGAPPDVTISSENLLTAFKQGLSRPHFYWGVSLGSIVSPGNMNISKSRVDAILEDLAREGYVKRTTQGTFRLRRSLQEFCVSLLLVPAFMSLQLRVIEGGAPSTRMHVAALRGANCLWLLEFFEDDGGVEVAIESCRGQDLLDFLREIVTAPVGIAAEPPTAAAPAPDPVPTAELPMRCAHCAHPLRQGARFCTSCGQAQPEPPPPEPHCDRCGKPVPRHGKFCTACGAPQAGAESEGEGRQAS